MSTTETAGTDRVREAAGQAREKAADVAGEAQEQAQQMAGKAKGRVRTQVDERSTEAGERIVAQADDIRTVGQSLREQGSSGAADVADQAAERIERLGGWLRDRDGDAILGEIEDVARRNPWAVLAGSVAAGFAISRVLKASSGERYRERTAGASGIGRPTGGGSMSAATGTTPTGTTPGPDTAATSRTGRFDRAPGVGVQTGTAGQPTQPLRDPGSEGRPA